VVDHRRERGGDRDRGAVLALDPLDPAEGLGVPPASGAPSRYLLDPSCVFPSVDAIVTEHAQQTDALAGRVLAELYERHVPASGRLAYLLTGDRAMAEDLVQEAFVRVVGRFRHLRVPDAFEAYLRRTIVNLHTSQLRRRRLERAYLEREGRAAELSITNPDVDAREELWRAMLALPPRQRAAVVLRFYEDLSERETADALGCSPSAAKSLVARAMQTLRARIESETA
jgi:RNA polymerase sigma-70 factor (sigma-E family)